MKVLPTLPANARKCLGTFLRWTGDALLLVAIACLGWYVSDSLQARLYGAYEETRLADALKSVEHVKGPPPPRNNGDFIGQLDIPRIGVRAIILEGDDDHTLRFGVGHIPGTALPGEQGNISLAGHRDSFFRPLLNIRRDDQIRLTTFEGFRDYRVDWIRVVKPQEVKVLKPAGQPTLTLITCYPFHYVGSAPERFVVRAHRIPEWGRVLARPEDGRNLRLRGGRPAGHPY